jgi:predicted dehydrogenase
MAKRKLQVGVIGLGRIGWNYHCKTLAKHRDWHLAAVADPAGDRLREATTLFGCQAFQSCDHMLADAELDAVVVASPTHLHRDHAMAALARKLHVMMEKPLAANLVEAQAIVRTAKRRNCLLTVYQPHRAAAYFQQLLRIVRSGRIGKVYHVKGGSFRFVRRNDWQSLRKYGGGMLNNYGAHRIDQLLTLTGPNVKRVFGHMRRVLSLGDAEDVVKLVYETRDGVIGEMDINQASPTVSYEMEIYGTRGNIVKHGNKYTIMSVSPRQLARTTLIRDLAAADRKYPRDDVEFGEKVVEASPRYQVDVYRDFARAIRTGGDPLVTPSQALSVMRLIDRCRNDGGRIVATPFV